MTVSELAARLGVDAKRIRAWIQRQDWRNASLKGLPYNLSREQAAEVVAHFDTHRIRNTPSQGQESGAEGRLAGLTVGELLETYNEVLLELRARR